MDETSESEPGPGSLEDAASGRESDVVAASGRESDVVAASGRESSRRTVVYSVTIAAYVAAVLFGCMVGAGGFTFVYARGFSYFEDDPAACANCHIMDEQYDGWLRGSHHAVATCNDCHTPHDFVGKYLTKMRNGWNHSVAFTTGWFHEPIQINASNRQITEQACRYCHAPLTESIDHGCQPDGVSCLRCHADVGHLH